MFKLSYIFASLAIFLVLSPEVHGKSFRKLVDTEEAAEVPSVGQEKVQVYIEGPRGSSVSTETNVHVPDRQYVTVYYDVESSDFWELETDDKSINVHVDVPKVPDVPDIPKVPDVPKVPDIPNYNDFIPNYSVNVHVPGEDEANLNYDGETIDASEQDVAHFVTETSDSKSYDYYVHGYPGVAIEVHLPTYYENNENVNIVRDMDDLEVSPEDLETENKSVNVHVDVPKVPNYNVPGVPNVNVNSGIPNVNVHVH